MMVSGCRIFVTDTELANILLEMSTRECGLTMLGMVKAL